MKMIPETIKNVFANENVSCEKGSIKTRSYTVDGFYVSLTSDAGRDYEIFLDSDNEKEIIKVLADELKGFNVNREAKYFAKDEGGKTAIEDIRSDVEGLRGKLAKLVEDCKAVLPMVA